jgi:uncharacterized membrane protein YesL
MRRSKRKVSKPDFVLPESTGRRFFFLLKENYFELLKLSLLFTLFCLPLVTIPAAVTALSYVVSKLVNDRLYFVWHDFFKSFKANFVRSTIYGLLWLAAAFILVQLWGFSNQQLSNDLINYFIKFFVIVLLILLLNHAAYFHPIQAWIDLPFASVLKNALIIQFVGAKSTLKMFIVLLLSIGLTFFLQPISLLVIPFLFSLIAFILCTFAMEPIQKYLVLKNLPPEDLVQSEVEN